MIQHVLCFNKCGPMKRMMYKSRRSDGKVVWKPSPYFYCPECLYDTSPIVGNKVHEVFGDLNPDPRSIKRVGNKWTSTDLKVLNNPKSYDLKFPDSKNLESTSKSPESRKHFKFFGGKLSP